MALSNLLSVNFTAADLEKLDVAMVHIQEVLDGKAINLTSEQRSLYGRINEENKILINRVKDMDEINAEMHPPFLDQSEFDADYAARQQLERRADKLTKLTEMLVDTKTLLDYDNYNYAISYYRYIKMLSTQEVPGSTTVYQNLREVYESQISASRKALNAIKDLADSTSEVNKATDADE